MRLFRIAGRKLTYILWTKSKKKKTRDPNSSRYLRAVSHAHRSPQCKLITIIKRIICMFNNVLNIRHSTTTEFITRRWARFENIVNLTTVNAFVRTYEYFIRAPHSDYGNAPKYFSWSIVDVRGFQIVNWATSHDRTSSCITCITNVWNALCIALCVNTLAKN